MKRSFSLLGFSGIFLVLCLARATGAPIEVRLGTILPSGLEQTLTLRKLQQDWNLVSGGTVHFSTSPAGKKDGEATIVKKLRSSNYQAALLSVVGLSEIEQDVSALQNMPLVFRNWAEVDHVREKVRGKLEQKLKTKGFVVLFWADSGWVNLFSTRKATTPGEYRNLKLFTWAGDDRQVSLMKSMGYKPVVLETENLHSSFATGMIDAAPLAPAYALGIQVPTLAPFVLDLKWAPIVGAAIIRQDVWGRIPTDLQQKFMDLSEAAGQKIRAEGRRFHDDALATLAKGPKTQVYKLDPSETAAWEELGRSLGAKIRGSLVPADMYDEVQSILAEFRAGQAPGR